VDCAARRVKRAHDPGKTGADFLTDFFPREQRKIRSHITKFWKIQEEKIMENFIALFSSEYFTAGKIYTMVDYLPENIGVIVYDNQGYPHGLSYDFLCKNFRKI
jgi:hypothetical protein